MVPMGDLDDRLALITREPIRAMIDRSPRLASAATSTSAAVRHDRLPPIEKYGRPSINHAMEIRPGPWRWITARRGSR